MKQRLWTMLMVWVSCAPTLAMEGADQETRTHLLWQPGDQVVLCAANAISTNAAAGKFEAVGRAEKKQVPMRQRRCLHLIDASTSDTVEIRSHHFIGVQPGTRYEITARVRGRDVAGEQARVLLRFADPRRDLTREMDFALPDGGDKGQVFRREFVTPDDCGALFLAIQASPRGRGEWWMEDVTLRQCSESGSALTALSLLRWKAEGEAKTENSVRAHMPDGGKAVQVDLELNESSPKLTGVLLRLMWGGAQMTTDTCWLDWELDRDGAVRGMIEWKRRSADLQSTLSLLRYPLALAASSRAIQPPMISVPRGAAEVRLQLLAQENIVKSFEMIMRREVIQSDADHE